MGSTDSVAEIQIACFEWLRQCRVITSQHDMCVTCLLRLLSAFTLWCKYSNSLQFYSPSTRPAAITTDPRMLKLYQIFSRDSNTQDWQQGHPITHQIFCSLQFLCVLKLHCSCNWNNKAYYASILEAIRQLWQFHSVYHVGIALHINHVISTTTNGAATRQSLSVAVSIKGRAAV